MGAGEEQVDILGGKGVMVGAEVVFERVKGGTA